MAEPSVESSRSPSAQLQLARGASGVAGAVGAIVTNAIWNLVGSLRRATPTILWFSSLSTATIVLFSYVFPPWSFWPLALICLAPWTIAVLLIEKAWVAHWGSFIAGFLFFLINLYWLMPVTGLGYAALAMYLGGYWTLAAWAVRSGQRAGLGPTWTLPVVWVACEYLRGWVMSGFPWLFLGHAFHSKLMFIQISDITGAYGVTFLAAMVNGMIATIVLAILRPAPRRRWLEPVIACAATLAFVSANLAYGASRLGQAKFETGPRVAVVQEDFPLVSTPPYGEHPFVVFAKYLSLAGRAAQSAPNLLAFPETVWTFPLNQEFVMRERQAVDDELAFAHAYGRRFHTATSAFARGDYAAANEVIAHLESRMKPEALRDLPGGELPRLPAGGGPATTLVVGSTSLDVNPDETYPKKRKYNSALIYDPDGQQRPERYDKTHLVPFGESVPFRNSTILGFDLHWLYRLLNRLSPFSEGGKIEYSLWSGTKFTVFRLNYDGKTASFGTPICYEDVMPYVIRNYVWDGPQRRVDFLVNISNDGWFLHSAELPQHLAICVFRAIENRVSIARSVNTGVSGFIDPNGRVYSLVNAEGRTQGPGIVGFQLDHVLLDSRASVYGQYGDVFAGVCLALASILWLGAILTRWVLGLYLRLFGPRVQGDAA